MPVLLQVQAKGNYQLHVKYADGVEGVVDLSDYAGQGVFALWNGYSEFERAHVGSNGEIAWNDEVDLDADAIYFRITGRKPEELYHVPI